MTNDHKVNIKAHAEDVAHKMEALLAFHNDTATTHQQDFLVNEGYVPQEESVHPEDDAFDAVEGWVLDVEHTARWFDNGTGRGAGFTEPEMTTILLTCGGPTVRVDYSHRYGTAELFHSWGMMDGVDRTTYAMSAPVGEFISTFLPHPCEV